MNDVELQHKLDERRIDHHCIGACGACCLLCDCIYAIKKEVEEKEEYRGCNCCKHQPEPMQTCDWMKRQTKFYISCPRWEKKDE